MTRLLALGSVLVLFAACSGSNGPGEGQAIDQLTLYSIDFRYARKGKDALPPGVELFCGCPVLGRVDINDPLQRTKLAALLRDAISRRPDTGLKSFDPRHGVRIVERGRVSDYAICFECAWFVEFINGASTRFDLINTDVQAEFERPLTDAGIEFVP